ncbi:cob(I)yrinic acid a,c-diamide adenosyltransferase [Sedimentibacter hydroxybenzoicus DSM 7310]|uniref:Corrinoid adenosyltransferase n=1 Tax=Sedimentibacter hydroxybenzoicus DSM 7310 TaxID=1123245 RepID=A0A974GX84_SEDHY|nr:cob(I)yrinic acid a,c-diamide adenosyltransferase [Sedimentibacter hydroxybenzoicus]NYB75322.1 cob(I)yrinic acid a,c-diamide adenosyltransferase [Sedimentibacter hydroxybenzoicus DSM 7310]
MKIYTKTGDKGQTSLYDGTRVYKDSLRVESYGTVDELNSSIGFAMKFVKDEEIKEKLKKIQMRLFFVAGELATVEEGKYVYKIKEEDIVALEKIIDDYLPKIKGVDKFIVPGSSEAAAALHVSRTICRRAERRILTLKREESVSDILLKFVNRLSDVLYTYARYLESDLTIMDFEKFYNEKL